jgi:hypothetical protein
MAKEGVLITNLTSTFSIPLNNTDNSWEIKFKFSYNIFKNKNNNFL